MFALQVGEGYGPGEGYFLWHEGEGAGLDADHTGYSE